MNNFILLFLPTSMLCALIGYLLGAFIANKRASRLTEDKIRAEARAEELENRASQLEEAFTSKATEILANTSEKSKESHSEQLKKIVDPLEQLLKQYRKDDIAERASLKTEIKNLESRN